MESVHHLSEIWSRLCSICITHQIEKVSFEKKIELYRKANILISEAKRSIEILQTEMKKLENMENIEDKDINPQEIVNLIDLIDVPNPNFKEIVYIIRKLLSIQKKIPDTLEMTDAVEKNVICFNDDFEEEIINLGQENC